MRWSLFLGKLFGIKLYIHWTFTFLIAWIIYSNIKQGLGISDIIWSIIFILTVFACLTFHELGHALSARNYGIKTKDIILLPIGGMARLESIPEVPKQELIVAIAGPMVNFVIAGILFLYLSFTGSLPEFENVVSIDSGNFIFMLFTVNLILGVFNLIPAFPMDGGRILRAFLAMKFKRQIATRMAATVGPILAVGFVILGLFSNPFLIIIGIFIFLGAKAEAEYTESKAFLAGFTVSDVTMKNFEVLNVSAPLSKAIAIILDGQAKDFIVMDGELVVGGLSRDEIIRALYEYDSSVKIGKVMNPNLTFLSPSMPLEKLYQTMQNQQLTISPVIENDKLIGVVDKENIMEFIMIQSAYKQASER